jgi:hypothetical protein
MKKRARCQPQGILWPPFLGGGKNFGIGTRWLQGTNPNNRKCHRQADTKGGTNRQGECRKQIAERERAGELTGAVIGLAIAAGRIA